MSSLSSPASPNRSQFHVDKDSSHWFQRFLAYFAIGIEGHLTTKNDDADTCENKLAVFLACLVLSLRGLTWGTMYVVLGAYWSCISPFLLVLTNCCGLVHMCITKRMFMARQIMACSLAFCSLYVHWSLASQSGTVFTWSLLAPQLLVLTGGTITMSFVLFMVSTTVLIALLVLRCTGQLSGLTPQGAILSDDWIAIFEVLNVLFPAFMSSLLIWLTVARMRKHRGQLEKSVAKAEVIGQMIVDFNLDCIDAVDANKDDRIVHILKQVAFNLQLYRPFIPSHLLKHSTLDSDAPKEETVSLCTPIILQTATIPDIFNCDSQSSRPSILAPMNVLNSPPERIIRAPGGIFEVPHQMRVGSLLYIQLHQLEAFTKQLVHYDKLDCIYRTSSLFAEIVTEALRETHGVLQNIEHNACLVSWNFISTSHMHAEKACHAALMIRDRLRLASGRSDLAPLTVSMGLWSGLMVSGSFGTPELKSQGVIGYGVKRVMDLQYYAAVNQYAIVANAEIFHSTSLTPKVKLVPIDIISIKDCETVKDLRHPSPATDTEVLYEVVSLLPVTDDEWMYQLQAATGLYNPVQTLESLLLKIKNGLNDVTSFQAELLPLLKCADSSVAAVAGKLEKLHRQGTLNHPQYSQLFRIWTKPFSLNPRSPSPLHVTHSAAHLTHPSTTASRMPRQASYSSLNSEQCGTGSDEMAPARGLSSCSRGSNYLFPPSVMQHPLPMGAHSTPTW